MVDVIIPSYNDNRIINTIKSIKNYEKINHANIFRLIIIDGGSQIDLINILNKILSSNDILITEPDNGIVDALNKGLNLATNDLIWWIGSDDLLNINIPFFYFDYISNNSNYDCFNFRNCYFNSEKITRSSSISSYTKYHYLIGMEISHFSTIWKRDFIDDLRFNTNYKNASDLDFFYYLILEKNARIKNINYTLSFMREGGKTSKNLTARKKNYIEVTRIYKSKYNNYFYLFPVLFRMLFKFYTLLKLNITNQDKVDFKSLNIYID